MKIAIFDTHTFERRFLESQSAAKGHELTFFEPRLTEQTTKLAAGFLCVSAFVNDRLNREVLEAVAKAGTKLIALRCAGFNHVDLEAASELGIRIVRVPEYSPYAVAEHAVALILTLNRKTHRAFNRVREGNFSLDGLVGFDLHGKTIGVIGTGRIGAIFANIMKGFGCQVVVYDLNRDPQLEAAGIKYLPLEELFRTSDVISLHVPLNLQTRHLIDEKALASMKEGVMLINTGRGALIDTVALIGALKCGKIGYAGLDVYEEEEGVFFQDLSGDVLQDDILARLLTFPNVVLTSHQAFLTKEALESIASTTMENVKEFEQGSNLTNEVKAEVHLRK